MEQQQLVKRFEKDSEWFYKNVDKLRKLGYSEQFVAIKNAQPIASDKSIEVVIRKLDKNKEDPSFIFIEFVHPDGYVLLL